MSTKVITGKVRTSYCKLMRPQKNEMNGKLEYSSQILIPKSDSQTVEALRAAAKAAMAAKWPTPPKGLRNPLRDGDAETKADGSPLGKEYAGCWFINVKASEDRKPTVIDMSGNELFEVDSVVSGDYIRVSVNAYAYDAAGNRGVAFGLNNVQLVAKGEPLGAPKMSAADEFGVTSGAASSAPTSDDWA